MSYANIESESEKISYIKSKLSVDPRWAIQGLLRVYEFQTESEKNIGATTESNGVGFNGADGDILTSFANQINRGRTLSPKQLNVVYKKMPKYARQLYNIAQSKLTA